MYIGQIRYALDGVPVQPQEINLPGRWKDIGIEGQVIGSRWHRSADGTIWEAVDVDVLAVQHSLSQPDEVDEEPMEVPGAHEWVWLEAESYWYTPTSSTKESCATSIFDDEKATYWIYDGESIFRNQSLETWERSVVTIHANGSEASTCNGVFVGTDDDPDMKGWVLTAAHCLFDEDHNQYEALKICAAHPDYPEVVDCQGTESNPEDETMEIFIQDTYQDKRHNPGDDIALIRVPDLDSTYYQALKLSEARDSFVTSFEMTQGSYNWFHFDSHTHECGASNPLEVEKDGICFCQDNWFDPDGNLFKTSFLMTQRYDISAPFYTDTFRSRADSGDGFSGSPVWYCGRTECSLNSHTPRAGVVSVISGHNGVYKRHVGPKVREHRAWAFTAMEE
ncbi:MAG: hypothetical protein AAFV53_11095 [Myxococcota bacterium]